MKPGNPLSYYRPCNYNYVQGSEISPDLAFSDQVEWDKFPLGIRESGTEFFWSPLSSPHLLVAGSSDTDFLFNIIFHARWHPAKWEVFLAELRGFIPDYAPYGINVVSEFEESVKMIKDAEEEMDRRLAVMKTNGVSSYLELPVTKGILVLLHETSYHISPSGIKTDEGKAQDAKREIVRSSLERITLLGGSAGIHLVLGSNSPRLFIREEHLLSNCSSRFIIESSNENFVAEFLNTSEDIEKSREKGISYYSEKGKLFAFNLYHSDWNDQRDALDTLSDYGND